MMTDIAQNKPRFGTPTWEVYLNDPNEVVSEDDLETDIYVILLGAS